MSGHSKWAQIKHKKAATDAKRGRIFTRLIREITVAARTGGGDAEVNARLRVAIAAAKAANMPQENIERAIKRGTGELEGVSYEEVTYEAYGPGGVAILIEAMTDNKNRTVAAIRHTFSRFGGNLGETGCVSWMFKRTGLITIPSNGVDEDRLIEVALDAGAQDVRQEDEYFEVYTDVAHVLEVKEKLEKSNFAVESAEITAIPQSYVHLEGKEAEKLVKLLSALEELDDVQKVHSNMDVPDEILAQVNE